MSGSGPLRVAIVGCGNIAGNYAKSIATFPEKITLMGLFDIDPARSQTLAQACGAKVYDTLESVIADKDVDAVINLTIHQAHVEITTKCLEAGKHVHTEKPLAIDPIDAKKLVQLAKRKKVRLSAAPTTFLGEAQQTAWRVVRDGQLGPVRVVYAEMNWGRPEKWHPNPVPFYEVGSMYDVGVYPLTVMTTILGRVSLVRGFGKVLSPDRTMPSGEKFHLETPDWLCGFLEFEGGAMARLTADFYVGPTKQHGIEFHGDTASLHLSSAHDFNAKLQTRTFGTPEWLDVPLAREPYPGVEWARGIVELHDAIREDRPQRATGEHAAHVVEIVAGIHKSAKTGKPVAMKSTFDRPEPMEWAR